jgi:hypothetical protein
VLSGKRFRTAISPALIAAAICGRWRLQNVFVGGPLLRPLSIELRILLAGPNQGIGQCPSANWLTRKHDGKEYPEDK